MRTPNLIIIYRNHNDIQLSEIAFWMNYDEKLNYRELQNDARFKRAFVLTTKRLNKEIRGMK